MDCFKRCNLCSRKCSKSVLLTCPSCKAVFYCNDECMKECKKTNRGPHGHHNWCTKMTEYMAKAQPLADLPFSFTKETTSCNFNRSKYRDFLKACGVFGLGFWRRECEMPHEHDVPDYGNLAYESDPYVLPLEGLALEEEYPAKPQDPLKNWLAYYNWRGFRLNSPIAILLQFPLTLYHILMLMGNDYPEYSILQKRGFRIHILGIEKEADMIPVFKELGNLLPDVSFEVHMIGPNISRNSEGKVADLGNVKVTTHKTVYHKFDGEKPDLAIGFNAGLCAYMTWNDTLAKLKESKTRAYFTDYCLYSCECSKQAIEGLNLGTISTPIINPFRSHVRKYCDEHDMPWYSNGFIYQFKYSVR